TIMALAILVLLAPGERRWARAGWTALGLLPLVPLGATYLRLTRRGGPIQLRWENLPDPLSLRAWSTQFAWADPVPLARKVGPPFVDGTSVWYIPLSPLFGLLAALALGALATARRRGGEGAAGAEPGRRAWGVVAAALIIGGVAGPDTLGPSH